MHGGVLSIGHLGRIFLCVGNRLVVEDGARASRQERGSSFLSAGFEFGIQSKRRKQSASQGSDGLDAVYGKALMSER